MFKPHRQTNNSLLFSFSLIEVLIFISILSLFFVAATAVTVASLRNMQINKHKILATRYGEELLEWLRGEKEVDWNNFILKGGNTYCFDTSPVSNWPSAGNCANFIYLTPPIYKREATLGNFDCGGGNMCQVNITINVSWQELGNTYIIPIKSVFTLWE